ncbi:MAG: KamA family radical SAM protein [Chlamydiales bacterium]|nr:KamA family radical SAM protein [Chlamydiales bacterium]
MSRSPAAWREILRHNFTDWNALANFLELTDEQRQQIFSPRRFPLNLPRRLAEKIAKGTLDDPILRQFVPNKLEEVAQPGFGCDPVGDDSSMMTSKLLKKYQGRALLICTSACAMHCRYCFRQHFDYDVKDKLFHEELEAIRQDSSIHEVILSGGDPLSLSDNHLKHLVQDIADIPHVKRLRFHSRFPIGIPERVDEVFLSLFDSTRLSLWFVIHSNHASELDEDVLAALQRLKRRGFMLLNQAVLLRGVNDTADSLAALCEKLANNGVLPYYLHQLDRAKGVGHFEVSEEEGHALIKAVSARLSGYAVPKYVREVAGEANKIVL